MELGLTIPLQWHLKIRSIPYGEEAERKSCWDLHVIALYGRASLLAVHCYSRYAFTLFDLSGWDWDDLPDTFLMGLRQSFQSIGISGAVIENYLRYAGGLRITKTHGRREVAYLNRAWEDVLSFDYTVDRSVKAQPILDRAVNTRSCRCAGEAGLGKAEERILHCLRSMGGKLMLAYTYIKHGRFELQEKPKPVLQDDRDAIVRVTLASICTSDLHIKHGSVPRAVPGITVGHEMVGIVEEVGGAVAAVKPGDRVTVNVETFCGECFFCRHGWVNNCTDPNGGWALGCRIDGGQAEYVRVPYADQGLNKIPDTVTDRQALFVGDILATGYWAADISEIQRGDTVLVVGAGPTGICALQCVLLKEPKQVIVCEKDPRRIAFVKQRYPQVLTAAPEDVREFVRMYGDHGGADVVLEVAGGPDTFPLAWQCARPNAIVTVVALYDGPQALPLPDMYGKNLTFKTGGVDGCKCGEILSLIEQGKIDTTSLITHTYPLRDIAAAYELFENRRDGVIKVAISMEA